MEKANVLPEKEKELNEKIKILAQTIKFKEEKKEEIKNFVENLGSEDYQSFLELILN